MILVKNIFQFLFMLILGMFLLETVAIGVENFLELHSGKVKLIRDGKSQILQNTGETYALLANDLLQTGKETQITLFLKNRGTRSNCLPTVFLNWTLLQLKETVWRY
jgi:hypothetical protein